MKREEKARYLEQYKEAKKNGEPFFPDAIFKDAVVMLIVFAVLVALSYIFGASLEARANPADTSYVPKPEWYFLFVFQLLKYFPGSLEVVGVVVIPLLVIAALIVLPYLDKSSRRHPFSRPWVMGVTTFALVGISVLTYLAVASEPPIGGELPGDQVAALYAANCAGCHGASIDVSPGTDLHAIITQGNHEGMPAWSGDLSTDEVDALAGYIGSPNGHLVFQAECAQCHEATDLAAGDPFAMRAAIANDASFTAHAEVDTPDWSSTLSKNEQTSLLNFLVAPDGQRLYTENCSSCHGTAVVFSGTEDELHDIIAGGGQHRAMPQWAGVLTDAEIDQLARYTMDPASEPDAGTLFTSRCSSCHGDEVPRAADLESARTAIATGGSHVTMPIWGDVLTPDQLDALVAYTEQASKGTGLAIGQQLYQANCSPCHGEFGEGGPLPSNPARILAPISTAEFLTTRDDATIRAIISKGQPDLGMSPFAISAGGALEDDDISALVGFIRSWQADPPVEFPPEISQSPIAGDSDSIYVQLCAQCHGVNGLGGVGPSFVSDTFQAQTDEQIFATIRDGHNATGMIAWGDLLTSGTISDLVAHLRGFGQGGEPTATATFGDIDEILQAKCAMCHGAAGGWDASSYDTIMQSGNNAPVIIPGDPNGSLLVQKLRGTQTEGGPMPPGPSLSDAEIESIVAWITAGATQ